MKIKTVEHTITTDSSGNVFADLGLPNADLLLEKADRLSAIRSHLRRSRSSTKRASIRLGISEAELAALRSGRFSELDDGLVLEAFLRLPLQKAG